MVPTELEDLENNYDPEDFSIRITDISTKENSASCKLEVTITDLEEESKQYWTINITGYKRSKLDLKEGHYIEILTDHPLLWKYNDVRSSLYFHGTCSDPDRLLLDLCELTEELFDGMHNLTDIKRYRYILREFGGLLANGPGQLLEQYAQLLEKYALRTSMVGAHILTGWNGSERVPLAPSSILRTGKNYIIGESFTFTRLK